MTDRYWEWGSRTILHLKAILRKKLFWILSKNKIWILSYQTTELYSNLDRIKEVNKVFKTSGLVKFLQLLIMKREIEEDSLIQFNMCLLKEKVESKKTSKLQVS